jgi:hypothetical protein
MNAVSVPLGEGATVHERGYRDDGYAVLPDFNLGWVNPFLASTREANRARQVKVKGFFLSDLFRKSVGMLFEKLSYGVLIHRKKHCSL